MIVDYISLDIELLNSLYLICWHYYSSGEGTNLCSSELSSTVEITMAYWLGEHPFPWPLRITTPFEYQL